MENLNVLTDLTDAVLGRALFSQAEAISHLGVIVATGWYDTDEDGRKDGAETERVFVLVPCPAGDIDIDSTVNYVDFDVLASQYGLSGCAAGNNYCAGADVNQDSFVDVNDLKIMAENWLIQIW
jgi:hypothetical protein